MHTTFHTVFKLDPTPKLSEELNEHAAASNVEAGSHHRRAALVSEVRLANVAQLEWHVARIECLANSEHQGCSLK